jgi:hypothetical protein
MLLINHVLGQLDCSEGSTNSIPRVTIEFTGNSTSYFVEDGSYARIQNIQLGLFSKTEFCRKKWYFLKSAIMQL